MTCARSLRSRLCSTVRIFFSAEERARDPETGEVSETRGIYPIGKGFERAASVELLLPDGSEGFSDR